MCRCKLTTVELKSRDLQRFRDSFHHDSVVIEEPDFDALSSLGLSRQIIERLRNRPLSRLLTHFKSIVSAGEDYQKAMENEKAREDRENDYCRKIQIVIEKRFEEWVSHIKNPPVANKDALILGARDADCRVGLYVRATQIADAAILAKTLPEKRTFISTATYPNRMKDKDDLEKFKGFSEEGSKDIDIYTAPNKKGDSFRICRGYRRVIYGDHGPYLELDKDDVEWEKFRVVRKQSHAYYDLAYTAQGNAKLYIQKRGVKHKPNPPPDGRLRTVRNNCREGYADYQPGCIYIDAFSVIPMISPIARNNDKAHVKKEASQASKENAVPKLQLKLPQQDKLGRRQRPQGKKQAEKGSKQDVFGEGSSRQHYFEHDAGGILATPRPTARRRTR